VIEMDALLSVDPLELHVSTDGLRQRENCGRVVASLFPSQTRWKIENAWVTSWIASHELEDVELMQFASDRDHSAALAELAETIEVGNVRVISPESRVAKQELRVLKSFGGEVVSRIAVHEGSAPSQSVDPWLAHHQVHRKASLLPWSLRR
jgi:hypothetical protein